MIAIPFTSVPKGGLIISDCMCGAGGSSLGMHRFFVKASLPIKRFVAINHDPDAIDVHSENCPWADHFCKDVGAVNLWKAFPEGYCDFGWASPTCTHHSRARGGKPIEDQLRNGPWEIQGISTEIHFKRWGIENVPEFVDWGPVNSSGMRIKSKNGEYFRAWKSAMEGIGYKFEWKVTNAADFGAGTTRERFLAQLTKKGRIYWAIPRFSPDGSGDLFSPNKQRWVGAREFLDLSLESEWILGRRVPLAAPTLSRGLQGLREFWGPSATSVFSPDIRDAALEGLEYNRREITKAEAELRKRAKPGLTQAQRLTRAKRRGKLKKRVARLQKGILRYERLIAKVKELLAATAPADGRTLQPFLVTLRGTSASSINASPTSLDAPAAGITTAGHHMLASPSIEPLVGGNRAHNVARPISKVAGAITTATGGGLFMVTPYAEAIIVGQHGGGKVRVASLPTSSITTDGAHALLTGVAEPLDPCFVVTHHTGDEHRSQHPDEPAKAITAKNGLAIVTPSLVSNFGERRPGESPRINTIDAPAPSIRMRRGAGDLIDVSLEEVRHLDQSIRERLLIGEDGKLYVGRLYFRMLHPKKELSRLMGFPADYKWPESTTKTQKFVGNAVHVDWAEAHVTAALGPIYAPEYIRSLVEQYGCEVAA